jgi:hypothetical protein
LGSSIIKTASPKKNVSDSADAPVASPVDEKTNPTWFENDGRAERPGLKGLAAPTLSSYCLPLIKSP